MAAISKQADRRAILKKIADTTLDTLKQGNYTLNNTRHELQSRIKLSKQRTRYYGPDSPLSTWSAVHDPQDAPPKSAVATEISFLEISTLDGARLLSSSQTAGKIGVLNFASAKKAGGGFISGASAQEESIARSSTLYPTLMTSTAQNFYTLHNRDAKGGYYSHAMIYSPGVLVFRDDDGGWIEPYEVDVLTSPAVNAGIARKTLFGRVGGVSEELRIEKVMRERMARILFLFENQGVRNIVLGSFGTGVFQNKVDVVGRIWADLLDVDGARFRNSFDRVVFAILGKSTFTEFKGAFEARRSD